MTTPADPRAPAEAASLSVGDVVADHYRIDAVLGEGGMGVVYRAEHLHLRKLHALKVLLPEWSSMPEVVARFEREAVAAGNIQSPHVVAATDFGRLASGAFFLVMEYVQGRTLRTELEAGPIDPVRALHIVRGIAAALDAAHALGIVHRDLKPENVMLVERGDDRDFVKVLDFGIAKVDEATGQGSNAPLTRVGAVLGTPDYMSPEQALGQSIDARSDFYAVGIILFEMLTGQCPFQGGAITMLRQRILEDVPELPVQVAAGVDPRAVAVLEQLMAKNPENRFASAAELIAALDECTRPLAVVIPPGSVDSPGRADTPARVWVTTSLIAAARAVEVAVRRTLAEPRSLVEHPSRGQVAVAATIVAVVVATTLALVAGARRPASAATAAPSAFDPQDPVTPTSAPVSTPESAPLTVLPPPPAPSASPSSRSPPGAGSSQGSSRRTGPGGIYIPPPSQWFK